MHYTSKMLIIGYERDFAEDQQRPMGYATEKKPSFFVKEGSCFQAKYFAFISILTIIMLLCPSVPGY
jgi:hypothetical protein